MVIAFFDRRHTSPSDHTGISTVRRLCHIAVAAFLTVVFLFRADYALADTITLAQGKLYDNGALFKIRGVVYTPVAIGGTDADPTAPQYDIPRIAAMHANTIITVKVGQYTQNKGITGSYDYYNALYPVAESYGLKIIISHFYSPSSAQIDWTNSTQVALETKEYQSLVLTTKNRPSTLAYVIGNEDFEHLSRGQTQYAQWIGQMVNWTHSVDPNHPVAYSFSKSESGMSQLKTYAPALDINAQNLYDWSTASQLTSEIQSISKSWPGKPVFIHESGSDSLAGNTENQGSQASRITQLVSAEEQDYASLPLIGSSVFNFSDGWQLDGNPSVHDLGPTWGCSSCFDGSASDEWFGLTKAVNAGQAASRVSKQAYGALRSAWSSP
jgi:hypothetical protein